MSLVRTTQPWKLTQLSVLEIALPRQLTEKYNPMKIELTTYDNQTREAYIAGTELTAPSVICYDHKFFALKICSAALTVKCSNDTTLQYRQCRGEFLSNIEIAMVADE